MAVSDNFNRADGGLGGNWTTVRGSWTVASNQAQDNSGTSGGPNATYWSANSFNKDQSSQIKVINNITYCGVGTRLKNNGSNAVDGYVYYFSFSGGNLQVNNSGSNSAIASVTQPTVGDAAKIDATSTTISVTINGVSGGGITDSTWDGTGAAPGLSDYDNGSVMIYDDWVGTGEISGAAATFIPHRMLTGIG